MAERRMFAKTIVLSDAFLDMPLGARCLYMTMGMLADDDGFVNAPKSIMRQCGASDDDMRVLVSKKFVIPFDSGVIVIKHWRINNYLQKDRTQPTKYQDEFAMLSIEDNGAYTEACIQNSVYTDSVSIDKVSIGKDSIDNNSIKDTIRPTGTVERIVEKWNTLNDLGIKPVMKIGERTQRKEWLSARLKTYTEEDFIKAIENIRNSLFLQGHNKNGWVITFDWFIRPNNFPKVLEGNYNNGANAKDGEINARQRQSYVDETACFFDSK